MDRDEEDLKEACRLLKGMRGQPMFLVLARLVNIHARALGYEDWADVNKKSE